MTTGVQTRSFTTTDRLTRVIGYVNATMAADSISVPGFADGTPWFAQTIPQINPGGAGRVISISGTTLSWGAGTAAAVITYGVY